MKRKWFLFIVTIYLCSFAMAQSQMITGTIVPEKNKSVVLLPGNKKDSLAAQKKPNAVPVAKYQDKATPDLQNTNSAISNANEYSVDPRLINLKDQDASGISTPQDSIKKNASTFSLAGKKINNPLDVLDTTVIAPSAGQDMISKYSLPPQRTTLRPQMISGKLEAKEGAAVTIVPVSEDSLYKQNIGVPANVMDNPLFPPERDLTKDSLAASSTADTSSTAIPTGPMKTAMDGLDTTGMVYDPTTHISASTSPLRPSEYKHQMISTGVIAPRKGEFVVIEPISKDSLEALNKKLTDTTSNAVSTIPDASNSNDSFTNSSFTDSSNIMGLKTNFFVYQNGRFTIRFATERFYLNISQAGKVVDFEILSNGKITSNASSKIVQVGNIKVDYNADGSIGTIAGVRLAYTYDGRVNRISDINISYNNAGLVEKVADIPIMYNSSKSVEKISNYRVGYDAKQMVIGIDDSNGLVVFKPKVE